MTYEILSTIPASSTLRVNGQLVVFAESDRHADRYDYIIVDGTFLYSVKGTAGAEEFIPRFGPGRRALASVFRPAGMSGIQDDQIRMVDPDDAPPTLSREERYRKALEACQDVDSLADALEIVNAALTEVA